jgi:hypothetical protein
VALPAFQEITITSLTASSSAAQSQAANIQLYEVPYQNWSSDAITNYTNAMTQINSIMAKPGGRTKSAGDTPQEVLFIVTDMVEDEMVNGSRGQSLMNNSYCTTIKNRGIRIAVLGRRNGRVEQRLRQGKQPGACAHGAEPVAALRRGRRELGAGVGNGRHRVRYTDVGALEIRLDANTHRVNCALQPA